MRKMGSQVGHVQILATLALAPAVITAWYAFHLVSSWRRADRDSILVIGQIPLVWPSTAFEWILLVGTVVRRRGFWT
jgi:hypothetical protein